MNNNEAKLREKIDAIKNKLTEEEIIILESDLMESEPFTWLLKSVIKRAKDLNEKSRTREMSLCLTNLQQAFHWFNEVSIEGKERINKSNG